MSVSQKIGVVVLLLAGFALAQAAFQLGAAQTDLTKGQRVQDAVPIRSALNALQAELEGEQLEIYALLASSKRVRGAALEPTLARIDARAARIAAQADALGQATLGDSTLAALKALEDLRARATEEFQKSAMTRDIQVAGLWREASKTAIRNLGLVRGATIPPGAALDAAMQDLLVRMTALERAKLELTDFVSVFGGFVASRGHLGPELAGAAAGARGRFDAALETVLAGDPQSSVQITDAALFQIADGLTDVSINGGDRPEGANTADWFAATEEVRESLTALHKLLENRLIRDVSAAMADARFVRNASAAVGMLCLLIVAGSIMIVMTSVVRPLSRAVTSIDQLADGRTDIDLSALPAGAEFGRLRSALDKLVQMSRQVDELNAQQAKTAEAKRAREREDARLAAERLEAEKHAAEEQQRSLQQTREAERRAAAEVAAVVAACAEGDFSGHLRTDDKDGVFAELCAGLNQVGATANEGLASVQTALHRDRKSVV